MPSEPSPTSIRFANRSDALAIAEMSRDLIEKGLGWSWTKERMTRCRYAIRTPTSWSRSAMPTGPASAS
jgi:hypothetical protein